MKINKDRAFALFLIFPLGVITKFIQYKFLGEKFFIDANRILELVLEKTSMYGPSYHFTANFFKMINFFKLDSLLSWSIYLSIIFSIIYVIFLYKFKNLNIGDYIYIYISMFLLYLFSFNLNKEIVQILFFLAIYLVILNKKKSDIKKLILINIILLIEALTFRSYYMLLIVTFDLSYYILNKWMNKTTRKSFIKLFMICSIIFLIILNCSRFVSPTMYQDLIDVRREYESSSVDANTAIKSLFPNDNNFMNYSLNYIFNTLRIVFPIELIAKSVKYAPFVLFQLLDFQLLYQGIKKLNKNTLLCLSILIGYFLLSGTYEPDFGSVIRHESVLLLFFVYLKSNSVKTIVKTEGEINE